MMLQLYVRSISWLSARWEASRGLVSRLMEPASRLYGGVSRAEGQTTAEYALVILAAAAVAVVLIAWARSSGKLPAFFDKIIDQITSSAQ
jgi:Flp pilus assembly pilin Flp